MTDWPFEGYLVVGILSVDCCDELLEIEPGWAYGLDDDVTVLLADVDRFIETAALGFAPLSPAYEL